jgi:hypothetical protein
MDWRPWAEIALYNAAVSGETLTSDEVWRMLQGKEIPPPDEPRAMGAVMIAGAKRGWVTKTEQFVVADNPATNRNHGRPSRVYRSLVYGADPVEWPNTQAPKLVPAIYHCPVTACDRDLVAAGPISFAPNYVTGKCPKHGYQQVRR